MGREEDIKALKDLRDWLAEEEGLRREITACERALGEPQKPPYPERKVLTVDKTLPPPPAKQGFLSTKKQQVKVAVILGVLIGIDVLTLLSCVFARVSNEALQTLVIGLVIGTMVLSAAVLGVFYYKMIVDNRSALEEYEQTCQRKQRKDAADELDLPKRQAEADEAYRAQCERIDEEYQDLLESFRVSHREQYAQLEAYEKRLNEVTDSIGSSGLFTGELQTPETVNELLQLFYYRRADSIKEAVNLLIAERRDREYREALLQKQEEANRLLQEQDERAKKAEAERLRQAQAEAAALKARLEASEAEARRREEEAREREKEEERRRDMIRWQLQRREFESRTQPRSAPSGPQPTKPLPGEEGPSRRVSPRSLQPKSFEEDKKE